MQNVKLIASDMDQTLLTSEGTLPPHFDRYLQRLNQAGIEFVAASGRPLYTLKPFRILLSKFHWFAIMAGWSPHMVRSSARV